MSKKDKFRRRIETIFKGYDISYYRESELFSWIEFNARPNPREYVNQNAYVTLTQMRGLAKLLGSDLVEATAYDVAEPHDDDRDNILYVIVNRVNFGGRR